MSNPVLFAFLLSVSSCNSVRLHQNVSLSFPGRSEGGQSYSGMGGFCKNGDNNRCVDI